MMRTGMMRSVFYLVANATGIITNTDILVGTPGPTYGSSVELRE